MCSGCAAIDHFDEALALRDFSQERDEQHVFVKAHDARFEELLRQVKAMDKPGHYSQKAGFTRDFGAPVFCRPEGALEKCLYRRIIKPLSSPRVYVYFDARGGLVRWQVN